MLACGRGQTHTQTDTQTRVTTIHFASSTTHAKCKNMKMNKSSAVAEMGDRLATIDVGREEGVALCSFPDAELDTI